MIEFPTGFFDDKLKIQVFHNNSTVKSNLVGKACVYLRDLEFNTAMHATGEPPIYPLTIRSSRGQFEAGTLFLNMKYSALSKNLLQPDWANRLLEASNLENKFEFFNDNLANEFKDDCQFGQLTVELVSLKIPLMTMNYRKQANSAQLNSIFMVKIRVAQQMTCIYVSAPDRILNMTHSKMHANIDSINDKVFIEFFDVLKEEAFDPKTANDMSNLKFLSQTIFEVRDFPFGLDGSCHGFKVLLPIEHSGNVASLLFNASFIRSVPSEDVEKPLVAQTLYLLFFRMIQTTKEMFHHHKDLDTSVLFCEVRNLTRQSSAQRRLFFNKEILEIGYVQGMLLDRIQVTFMIRRSGEDTSVPFEIQHY